MRYFLLFLFGSVFSYAQHQVVVSSPINKATVYLNQALLEHNLEINLHQGTNAIIVDDIANTIDPNTIKVAGVGEMTLLGIKYQTGVLNTKKSSLQDSVASIQYAIEEIEMLINVSNQEEKMIMANAEVKSETDGLAADELKEMALLFKNKLTEIGNTRLGLKRKLAKLNARLGAYQNDINKMGANNTHLGQIVLNVNAKTEMKGKFNIQYMAYNAGWKPNYDIRVKDIKSPVSITYKADIWQQTGIDWNQVKLTLSTLDPNVGGNKPELYPQYLSFFEPVPAGARMKSTNMSAMADAVEVMAPAPAMESAANQVVVNESMMSVSYDIKDQYTVNSSGRSETVEVQVYSVDADYKSVVCPKLDISAYVVADLKKWQSLKLIPAEAQVYFQNMFIGKTYLNSNQTVDNLRISLGKDLRIAAKRTLVEELKTRKTFGSNVKENFAFQIEVVNLKTDDINLVIEDQIPVSQDGDIEVELADKIDAEVDKTTGKLSWTLNLLGLQKIQKELHYTVKYPKDKTVNNL